MNSQQSQEKKFRYPPNSTQIPNTPHTQKFKQQPNFPQVEAKPITLYLDT
jgi:hypothetical protein